MDYTRLSKQSFVEFCERTKGLYQIEEEIISDKLNEGLNGFEWLVLNTDLTDSDIKATNVFIKKAPSISKSNEDAVSIMLDALSLSEEQFVDRHGFSYWLAIDETINYFAILRQTDYDQYCEIIQDIYDYKQ